MLAVPQRICSETPIDIGGEEEQGEEDSEVESVEMALAGKQNGW